MRTNIRSICANINHQYVLTVKANIRHMLKRSALVKIRSMSANIRSMSANTRSMIAHIRSTRAIMRSIQARFCSVWLISHAQAYS